MAVPELTQAQDRAVGHHAMRHFVTCRAKVLLYDSRAFTLYGKMIMLASSFRACSGFAWRFTGAALLLGFAQVAQADTPTGDFAGAWTVEWCDKNRPAVDCGGFTVHLLQKGDLVCGNHNGASPGLSKLDDGAARSIVGKVVGRTAVLTIESGRSEGIYLVSARKRTATIDWHRIGTVKTGNGDTDWIANRALMHKRKPFEGDQRQENMRAACQAFWASSQ
jgi:hypothetical protein